MSINDPALHVLQISILFVGHQILRAETNSVAAFRTKSFKFLQNLEKFVNKTSFRQSGLNWQNLENLSWYKIALALDVLNYPKNWKIGWLLTFFWIFSRDFACVFTFNLELLQQLFQQWLLLVFVCLFVLLKNSPASAFWWFLVVTLNRIGEGRPCSSSYYWLIWGCPLVAII